MARRQMPDADLLRKLFHYDPDSGKLFWLVRNESLFAHTADPQGRCASWNSKFAGREALTSDSGSGYRKGSIFDFDAYAHRVIWKLVTGEEPDQIDHLDGDRSNNRFSNLRNVGYDENKKNQAMKRNNTSGITGVRWCTRRNRWFAYIRTGGKMVGLGNYREKEDAINARKAAEQRYGYLPQHGRRAAAY